MTNKILIIIFMLGFYLTSLHIGSWANTSTITPRMDVEQDKTRKKDEKEKEKEIKRVWTNKDLKEIKKERLNITEVPTTPDDKKKKKNENKKNSDPPDLVKSTTTGKKYDPMKTEKYWRERKSAIVTRINKNEEEIERMQKKLFQQKGKLNGMDVYSERVKLQNEIDQTYNQIENYKRGLKTLRQDLENLYDEARRAGALPGWLRD